jgi:hypothetical protein
VAERREALAKPLWGMCKSEFRSQNSGVRIDITCGECTAYDSEY